MRVFEDDPGVMLEGCSCLLCLVPNSSLDAEKAAELMIRCLQKFPTKLGTSRVTDRRVALAVKVFKPRYQLPPRSHEADWVGRHTALM